MNTKLIISATLTVSLLSSVSVLAHDTYVQNGWMGQQEHSGLCDQSLARKSFERAATGHQWARGDGSFLLSSIADGIVSQIIWNSLVR